MNAMPIDTEGHGPAVTEDDPLIGYKEMARRAYLVPGTLHRYRSLGILPDPDDTSVPRRPRWRLSTFEAWLATRPASYRRIKAGGEGVPPAEYPVEILRLLAELKAAAIPDIWHVLNPPVPSRTRAHKAWVDRQVEFFICLIDLERSGLVGGAPNPDADEEQVALTDAGRAFLANQ